MERLESVVPQVFSGAELVTVTGLTAGARALLGGTALRIGTLPGRHALWVTPTSAAAEQLYESLRTLAPNGAVVHFPDPDPGALDEGSADAPRLEVLERLSQDDPCLVIGSLRAVVASTVQREWIRTSQVTLTRGDRVDLEEVHDSLVKAGYSRTSLVEARGEFSQRGCILDIYPATGRPVRLELFDDVIESIAHFELGTQRSTDAIEKANVLPVHETHAPQADGAVTLARHLPDRAWVLLNEPSVLKLHAQEWELADDFAAFQVQLQRMRVIHLASWGTAPGLTIGDAVEFDTQPCPSYGGQMEMFLTDVLERIESDQEVHVFTSQAPRITELMRESGIAVPQKARVHAGSLHEGCIWGGLVVITDREMLGVTRRRPVSRTRERAPQMRLEELEPGTPIVHMQHGIGVFRGVKQVEVEGRRRDFLHLEYARGDTLYVPVEHMDLVQKYVGTEATSPSLSRLGGQDWARTRRRVQESAREVAEQLLKLYAQREKLPGHAFSPDSQWQREVEAAFPFDETPDQLRAIEETKFDMERARPMDRLVCGDAGYGKTEVALRAAFKALNDGKQVAVLVPTTILAQQHYETFRTRLAPFPMKVEVMSRFRTAAEQKRVVEGIAQGTVDLVVGTHRLLGQDIKFKDLGLLIVDEEQHFGVLHKEKMREMKTTVDTLTLTATPIPRTLHMALSGVRDLSIIATPPEDRLPIKTYLFERSPEIIQGAILRELQREGQIFFVYNRVRGIEKQAAEIRKLVPQARVAIGHGQMDEGQLEKVMIDFMHQEYDVLVCTTIVESGLDLSNVNTIIIADAQNLGLSQLYQLRGRVGRGHHQAYCYLLYPPHRALTEAAERRLETIREFVHVGAGYQIAMRDLEIRGAGNLLGAEQSGFIADVGFDLYMQLLNEAVRELKGEAPPPARRESGPVLDLPLEAFIPDDYVGNARQKMVWYKRLAAATSLEELEAMREELRDRYGPLPATVQHLLQVCAIKILALQVGATSVKFQQGAGVFPVPFVGEMDRKALSNLYRACGVEALYHQHQLVLVDLLKYADWPDRLIQAMRHVAESSR